MRRVFRQTLLLCALLLPAMAARAEPDVADALVHAAPTADPSVIRLAVAAMSCAIAHGEQPAQRLGVIDYSRPSTKQRLWVFDLASRKLLFSEMVAHGRNSGDNYATAFSNDPGSYESSIGLFRTEEPYDGHNGYSLRMAGMEPGINDRAEERGIVIHGAPYVNTHFFPVQHRLGRSEGCPAVRPAVARPLIDALKEGQFVFAYYPDRNWLHASQYLQCPASQRAAAMQALEPAPEPRTHIGRRLIIHSRRAHATRTSAHRGRHHHHHHLSRG